jgi:hypothetical protein
VSTATHPDCPVCRFWESRLDEERARALAGVPGAYSEERRVSAELDAHLARHAPETQEAATL